jgi:hypothetical protein
MPREEVRMPEIELEKFAQERTEVARQRALPASERIFSIWLRGQGLLLADPRVLRFLNFAALLQTQGKHQLPFPMPTHVREQREASGFSPKLEQKEELQFHPALRLLFITSFHFIFPVIPGSFLLLQNKGFQEQIKLQAAR